MEIPEIQSFLKKEANRMKKNPTPAEERMKGCLESAKIRFQFQSIKFSKGTQLIDILLLYVSIKIVPELL